MTIGTRVDDQRGGISGSLVSLQEGLRSRLGNIVSRSDFQHSKHLHPSWGNTGLAVGHAEVVLLLCQPIYISILYKYIIFIIVMYQIQCHSG